MVQQDQPTMSVRDYLALRDRLIASDIYNALDWWPKAHKGLSKEQSRRDLAHYVIQHVTQFLEEIQGRDITQIIGETQIPGFKFIQKGVRYDSKSGLLRVWLKDDTTASDYKFARRGKLFPELSYDMDGEFIGVGFLTPDGIDLACVPEKERIGQLIRDFLSQNGLNFTVYDSSIKSKKKAKD